MADWVKLMETAAATAASVNNKLKTRPQNINEQIRALILSHTHTHIYTCIYSFQMNCDYMNLTLSSLVHSSFAALLRLTIISSLSLFFSFFLSFLLDFMSLECHLDL